MRRTPRIIQAEIERYKLGIVSDQRHDDTAYAAVAKRLEELGDFVFEADREAAMGYYREASAFFTKAIKLTKARPQSHYVADNALILIKICRSAASPEERQAFLPDNFAEGLFIGYEFFTEQRRINPRRYDYLEPDLKKLEKFIFSNLAIFSDECLVQLVEASESLNGTGKYIAKILFQFLRATLERGLNEIAVDFIKRLCRRFPTPSHIREIFRGASATATTAFTACLRLAIEKDFLEVAYKLIRCEVEIDQDILACVVKKCLQWPTDQEFINMLQMMLLDCHEVLKLGVDKKNAKKLAVVLNTLFGTQDNIDRDAEIDKLVMQAFTRTVRGRDVILEKRPLSTVLKCFARIFSEQCDLLLQDRLAHEIPDTEEGINKVISLCKSILIVNRDNDMAYAALAKSLVDLGDVVVSSDPQTAMQHYREARDYFYRAIRLTRDHPDASYFAERALCLIKLFDLDLSFSERCDSDEFSQLIISSVNVITAHITEIEDEWIKQVVQEKLEQITQFIFSQPEISSSYEIYVKGLANQDDALVHAVKFQDLLGVRALIAQGVDVNRCDEAGDTPFLLALKKGFGEIARELVERGADVNPQTHDGKTSLMLAIDYGCDNLACELMERGADVNRQFSGDRTPLELAINNGFDDLVRELIRHGADVNAVSDEDSPLDYAIFFRMDDIACELIAQGANLNPDPDDSLLVFAICQDLVDVAHELIAHGVDVNAKGRRPRSAKEVCPLRLAIEKRFGTLACELIAHGADVDLDTLKLLVNECVEKPADPGLMNALTLMLDRPEILETAIDEESAKQLAIILFNAPLDQQGNPDKVAAIEALVERAFTKKAKNGEIILDTIPLSALLDFSVGIISPKFYERLGEMLNALFLGNFDQLREALKQLNQCAAQGEDYLPIRYVFEFIARIESLLELDPDSCPVDLLNKLVRIGLVQKNENSEYLAADVNYNTVRLQVAALMRYAQNLVAPFDEAQVRKGYAIAQPDDKSVPVYRDVYEEIILENPPTSRGGCDEGQPVPQQNSGMKSPCFQQQENTVSPSQMVKMVTESLPFHPVAQATTVATWSVLSCVAAGVVGAAASVLVFMFTCASLGAIPAIMIGGLAGLGAAGLTLYATRNKSHEERRQTGGRGNPFSYWPDEIGCAF